MAIRRSMGDQHIRYASHISVQSMPCQGTKYCGFRCLNAALNECDFITRRSTTLGNIYTFSLEGLWDLYLWNISIEWGRKPSFSSDTFRPLQWTSGSAEFLQTQSQPIRSWKIGEMVVTRGNEIKRYTSKHTTCSLRRWKRSSSHSEHINLA